MIRNQRSKISSLISASSIETKSCVVDIRLPSCALEKPLFFSSDPKISDVLLRFLVFCHSHRLSFKSPLMGRSLC